MSDDNVISFREKAVEFVVSGQRAHDAVTVKISGELLAELRMVAAQRGEILEDELPRYLSNIVELMKRQLHGEKILVESNRKRLTLTGL